MNDALTRRGPRQRILFAALVLALVVALLVAAGARAATAPDANAPGNPSTTSGKDQTMNHFVLIFRQRAGELSAEELDRRFREVRAWAETQNAAGHALDPRILTAESERLEPAGGKSPADALPVTAILFVEARDLADAVEVARAHPALRFGASIEVRAWAPPPRVAPRP